MDAATVPAVTGRGAWLARMRAWPNVPPAVRFRDDAGRLVAPPQTGVRTRAPLGDAGTPCPACGETAWEVIEADRAWGGELVACTTCGHAISLPLTMLTMTVGGAAGEAFDEGAWEAEHARERVAALERVVVPVLWPGGWPSPELRGWGGSDGAVERLSLQAGDLHVELDRDEFRDGDMLSAALEGYARGSRTASSGPVLSDAAMAVRDAAEERKAAARALAAETRTAEIAVAGRPVAFAIVGDEDRWVAAGDLPGRANVRVVVLASGRSWRELALEIVPPESVG